MAKMNELKKAILQHDNNILRKRGEKRNRKHGSFLRVLLGLDTHTWFLVETKESHEKHRKAKDFFMEMNSIFKEEKCMICGKTRIRRMSVGDLTL